MLELLASARVLITSPYGLWKEAQAQGITRLLAGLLAAPTPEHWQRHGVLGQQQQEEHPRVLLLPLRMMTP